MPNICTISRGRKNCAKIAHWYRMLKVTIIAKIQTLSIENIFYDGDIVRWRMSMRTSKAHNCARYPELVRVIHVTGLLDINLRCICVYSHTSMWPLQLAHVQLFITSLIHPWTSLPARPHCHRRTLCRTLSQTLSPLTIQQRVEQFPLTVQQLAHRELQCSAVVLALQLAPALLELAPALLELELAPVLLELELAPALLELAPVLLELELAPALLELAPVLLELELAPTLLELAPVLLELELASAVLQLLVHLLVEREEQ
jgi:hypothetical protein